MNVIRTYISIKIMSKKDNSFVNAPPQERVGFMWDLTDELWSLRNKEYVKRRLQRNVTNLVKQRG